MNILYLVIQNDYLIFNFVSNYNTIFVSFIEKNIYLYNNKNELIVILNNCSLYHVYEYILNNIAFDKIYRIHDFYFEKYKIPDENYNLYANVIYKNNGILQYGLLLNKKCINYLIEEKIMFENEEIMTNTILKNKYIYINNFTKNAVIFFHKNIHKLYPQRWIDFCVQSVLNQKNIDFDILEINYGENNISLFENLTFQNKHYFYNKSLKTHTDAMTYLLNIGFNEFNYDIIYNTNLDDYYDENRFILQKQCILNDFSLCSSLWHYVEEIDNEDKQKLIFNKEMLGLTISNGGYLDFNEIKNQLNLNHNVINHSGVCFSKKIWTSFDDNYNLLRYRDDKPFEDLTFWQRVVNSNILITIIDKDLIHYRIHKNQIGSNKNNSSNLIIDSGFKNEPDKSKKRIGFYVKNDCLNVYDLYKYINILNNLETEHSKYFFIITKFTIDLSFIKVSNKNCIFICTDYSKNLSFFYPSIETIVDVIYYFYKYEYNTFFYNNLPSPNNIIIKYSNKFICGITHYFLKYLQNELK